MWVLYDTTWQDISGASRSSTVSVWPGEAAKNAGDAPNQQGRMLAGQELPRTQSGIFPRLADGTVSESYWAWRAVSKFKVLTGHSLGRETGTQQSSLHIMTSSRTTVVGTQMGS